MQRLRSSLAHLASRGGSASDQERRNFAQRGAYAPEQAGEDGLVHRR